MQQDAPWSCKGCEGFACLALLQLRDLFPAPNYQHIDLCVPQGTIINMYWGRLVRAPVLNYKKERESRVLGGGATPSASFQTSLKTNHHELL